MRVKVVFLAYSRYVIMISYIVKKLYHNNDYCTLLISDEMENENGVIEIISKSNIWDEVLTLSEKNNQKLYEKIDNIIECSIIDVFYFGHICRRGAHYFVHKLNNDTEINMIDEGMSSIDIYGTYEQCMKNQYKEGYALEFDKITNYYVLYPDITKPFYNVKIKKIEIEKFSENFMEVIRELNSIFGYKQKRYEKKCIIIDSGIGYVNIIPQFIEEYLINIVMGVINKKSCIIKAKPSSSAIYLSEKYEKYCCSFFEDCSIPFELLYLNMYVENDLPEIIIAFPTASVWNIILLNKLLKHCNTKIIIMQRIMFNYYLDDLLRIEEEKKFNLLASFSQMENVFIPQSYIELFGMLNKKYNNQNEWIIKKTFLEYKKIFIQNNINFCKKNFLLTCYRNQNFCSRLEKYLDSVGIRKVIIYGTGEIADIICDILEKLDIEIVLFVEKNVTNKMYRKREVWSIKNIIDEKFEIYPIIISSIGYEMEIINDLNILSIKNKVILLGELMRNA